VADQTNDEGFDPLPAGTEAPDPDAELTLQDAVAEGPEVVFNSEPPYPLGRSPKFDFTSGTLVPDVAGGPLMTYGVETLATWIEKCLRTKRGAYVACDEDFGVDLTWADVLSEGGPFNTALMSEYTASLKRGLTFHPRISDVLDIQVDGIDTDDLVTVSFRVELDGDDLRDVEFDKLPIGDTA